MEKGIQIALRYLENKLTRLINRGVLIKLTQSQNNYSNLHFYCSTLVFNIYFFEFAKLLGGPGPPPAPPHATALTIQCRLDYFLVSQDLCRLTTSCKIVHAVETDHSEILIHQLKTKTRIREKAQACGNSTIHF